MPVFYYNKAKHINKCQDPQGVVNGHPLTFRGLLMDILSVVLVIVHVIRHVIQ